MDGAQPEGDVVIERPAPVGVFGGTPVSPMAYGVLDASAALCAITLMVLAHSGTGGVARLLLALVFVSFVPGWAVLGHVPVAHGWSRVALAVALSLTLCTVGASAMAWLAQWQPNVLLDLVGGASVLAILASRARRR